jgi:hypothetical protein
VKNPIRNETSLVLVVAVIFSAVAIPVLSGFLEPSQPPAVAVVQIGQPRDAVAAPRDSGPKRDDNGPARGNGATAPGDDAGSSDDGADTSDDGASDGGVEGEAQSHQRPRSGGAQRSRPPRPASPAPPAQSAPSAPADDDAAEDDGGED